jgi:hypothetical protein
MKNIAWKLTILVNIIHWAYVEWRDMGDTRLHALALAVWVFVPMVARW